MSLVGSAARKCSAPKSRPRNSSSSGQRCIKAKARPVKCASLEKAAPRPIHNRASSRLRGSTGAPRSVRVCQACSGRARAA
ncbi:hypothetical protein E4U92_26360 [Streptomyces galbus]|uniref:Uncharacterized protein n=1 Tax=Streptomyces galbus TaxID=33898 RepID=A0A4U5WVY6_STRGB|nr:hypothetical protein E4U92_26360 [Streptomyces galbus]